MLMGDKYLAWVEPGSVKCTLIVLDEKMQYPVMKISSFRNSRWVQDVQNVFTQKLNNNEFSSVSLILDFAQFHKQYVSLLGSECVDS